MAYLWWGLAIVPVLLLLVWFLNIQLLFYFLRVPDHAEAYVRFFFFHGLLSFTFYIPFTNKELASVKKRVTATIPPQEAETFLAQLKERIGYIENLPQIALSFLKKVEVRSLTWRTAVGMKDAAWTGMLTGSLWAAKGSVLAAIDRLMKMNTRPDIEVTPIFGQSVWKVEGSCMISFRAGHAIAAVIQLFIHRRGRKKRSSAGLFF